MLLDNKHLQVVNLPAAILSRKFSTGKISCFSDICPLADRNGFSIVAANSVLIPDRVVFRVPVWENQGRRHRVSGFLPGIIPCRVCL
jgi:hypothetical protein